MQYKLAALSALAATVLAAPEKRQGPPGGRPDDVTAIYSVLATALPSSLIAEAVTNSAAFASDLSAEFASGSTPAWFASLPTSIQTYFIPATATAVLSTAPYATGASAWPTHSANSTLPVGSGTGLITATSSWSTSSSSASSSSSGASSSSAAASSASAGVTSSSTGGASMPTAMMGMGFAGVAGLVGVLAL